MNEIAKHLKTKHGQLYLDGKELKYIGTGSRRVYEWGPFVIKTGPIGFNLAYHQCEYEYNTWTNAPKHIRTFLAECFDWGTFESEGEVYSYSVQERIENIKLGYTGGPFLIALKDKIGEFLQPNGEPDLHGGNWGLRESGKIVIIDYGYNVNDGDSSY